MPTIDPEKGIQKPRTKTEMHEALSNLCHGKHLMCVPSQVDDSDIVLLDCIHELLDARKTLQAKEQHPHMPTLRHNRLSELVHIAIGEASMCWHEIPHGIFDDERARDVASRLIQDIRDYYKDILEHNTVFDAVFNGIIQQEEKENEVPMEPTHSPLTEEEKAYLCANEEVTTQPINEEIERRFSYHSPKATQLPRYERIRNFAKDFAYALDQMCPDSRERSLALTHLDEVVMFANASIARNE